MGTFLDSAKKVWKSVTVSKPPVVHARSTNGYAYTLTDATGIVMSEPEVYDRTNAYGTRFQGTTLYLRSPQNTATATMSYEGVYNIAQQGDRLDTMMCEMVVGPIKGQLAVAVLNHSAGIYVEIPANMEQCANDELGGIRVLREDMNMYAIRAMGHKPRS
ncbi:hypothetical protein [Mesorhizobium sp. ES1-1]|uniref:hypothetical protein n=1 Tax=Mesorhizobium sp. ES1-1 TaxID=2876629 RepID=UPI001CCA9326|nr:hypothetical protein [Mesorhizobium sp. ES1-1]MBZ9674539.1 hypothetical protein [Mesorhizobium sp. ES1-1]